VYSDSKNFKFTKRSAAEFSDEPAEKSWKEMATLPQNGHVKRAYTDPGKVIIA
jgi:hypothetical protein